MSTLIYIDNDDIDEYEFCLVESNPDHSGRVWDLLAVDGDFTEDPVPCSRRLREWIDCNSEDSFPDCLPGQLIIVEADDCESGDFPFTTSDVWLTFSDPDKELKYGSEKMSLEETRRMLRRSWNY